MEAKNKKNTTEDSSGDSSFGARLRKLRKNKGLSQTDFAKKIGYRRSGSISNIENNKTPPDIHVLIKIAKILDIDLHWLITGNRGLKNALSTLIDKEYLNDLYSVEAEKYRAAIQAVARLESKQRNAQSLTNNETESLLVNKKKEGVLAARLTMLTNHMYLTTMPLKGLLDNLDKE